MIRLFLAVFLTGFVTSAHAQSVDSYEKAMALGSVLAAEGYCGFSYDQAAISTWIDENTDPSDMGFASTLSAMTDGASFEQEGRSESQKTAHCRSTERTAKHFGFIR